MTWTWTSIIELALVRAGIQGRGQVAPNAQNNNYGMDSLQLLLDEWDGEGLSLPSIDLQVKFNTVSNQAKYLLGKDASGNPGATSIRPEKIETAIVTISTSPVVNITMVPMYLESYTEIPVPSTTSQPWNCAVNETWPQMEFYLYPTPSAIYPITLNSRIKWIDTVGDPATNPFAIAEVPSGYVTALVDNLALKLSQINRLDTPTLISKAAYSKSRLAMQVHYQNQPDIMSNGPIGLFSWNILLAGRNP